MLRAGDGEGGGESGPGGAAMIAVRRGMPAGPASDPVPPSPLPSALGQFLFHGQKNEAAILQRFVVPSGDANNIIRATWSPQVRFPDFCGLAIQHPSSRLSVELIEKSSGRA